MHRTIKIVCGILLLPLALGFTTACGATDGQNAGQQKDQTETMNSNMDTDQADLFSIRFTTDPGVVHSGQVVKLIENVSQKGKPITDATVKMEIWRDGDTNHKMIPAAGGSDGNYVVEENFSPAGTYHVKLHTTANGIHQMPTKEIQVQTSK